MLISGVDKIEDKIINRDIAIIWVCDLSHLVQYYTVNKSFMVTLKKSVNVDIFEITNKHIWEE